ncbi:MAG: YjbH domain-containing protein [Spirochaetales bacterium]|nr:YjbH domain-containing protein [Spirochaetales bacterium]
MPKLHDLVQQALEEIFLPQRGSRDQALETISRILLSRYPKSSMTPVLIKHFEIVAQEREFGLPASEVGVDTEYYSRLEELLEYYFDSTLGDPDS